MDKKYITLFKDLAQAIATLAEQVLEYNRQKEDEKGVETATTMRDDYQELASKIAEEDYKINKVDVARLLVGSMVQINQLQDGINTFKRAMSGYQTDIIPKLQEILDNAKDDEAVYQMAEEKFIIKDSE